MSENSYAATIMFDMHKEDFGPKMDRELIYVWVSKLLENDSVDLDRFRVITDLVLDQIIDDCENFNHEAVYNIEFKIEGDDCGEYAEIISKETEWIMSDMSSENIEAVIDDEFPF